MWPCYWTCLDLLPCLWYPPDWLQPSLVWLDPRMCPKGNWILQHRRSLLRKQCDRRSSNLAPSKLCLRYIFTPHPKVDASLSGGTLGETRGHVSNVALSEANEVFKCPHSAFTADAVAVALRTRPDPCEGLVNWIISGRWRNHNWRYIW